MTIPVVDAVVNFDNPRKGALKLHGTAGDIAIRRPEDKELISRSNGKRTVQGIK